MSVCGRRFSVLLLVLTGGGLCGCATSPIALPEMHENGPVRIMLMESPMRVGPGRLQSVLAPGVKRKLAMSEQPLSEDIQHAQRHASAAMQSALTSRSGLVVVAPPAMEEPFLSTIESRDLKAALSQKEADRIRSTTGADALLRFDITDYGLTPKSWRTAYVTFEVTSTLAIAGFIAYPGSTVARAAAGAYLVQETVEEATEAYAGFWGLDVVCRPVRIEAELIGLDPVSVLWKTSETGLSNVRLFRLVSKVGPDKKNVQLDQATDHAARDIAFALSGALRNAGPVARTP